MRAGLLAALALTACAGTQRNGELEARLARTEHQLEVLIARLRDARQLPPAEPDPAATYAVPIAELDPVRGPADAPITMIEAYEYLCPYCRRAEPTVQALRAKYGAELRVVTKYLVIHGAEAVPPGLLACAAARQGKFEPAAAALWGTLFDEDGQLVDDHVDAEHLTQVVASATGLDPDVLAGDAGLRGDVFGESACLRWIKESIDTLDTFHVGSTPAFFINGRYISGAQPLEVFERAIEDARARVLASGVPAASYYQAEVMGKGLTEVVDELAPADADSDADAEP